MLHHAAPVAPAPGHDIHYPGGRSASWMISANFNAVSGVVSAGFNTTVFPAASAGAIFHAAISKRKIPRNDLSGNTQSPGFGNWYSIGNFIRPSGIIKKCAASEYLYLWFTNRLPPSIFSITASSRALPAWYAQYGKYISHVLRGILPQTLSYAEREQMIQQNQHLSHWLPPPLQVFLL